MSFGDDAIARSALFALGNLISSKCCPSHEAWLNSQLNSNSCIHRGKRDLLQFSPPVNQPQVLVSPQFLVFNAASKKNDECER